MSRIKRTSPTIFVITTLAIFFRAEPKLTSPIEIAEKSPLSAAVTAPRPRNFWKITPPPTMAKTRAIDCSTTLRLLSAVCSTPPVTLSRICVTTLSTVSKTTSLILAISAADALVAVEIFSNSSRKATNGATLTAATFACSFFKSLVVSFNISPPSCLSLMRMSIVAPMLHYFLKCLFAAQCDSDCRSLRKDHIFMKPIDRFQREKEKSPVVIEHVHMTKRNQICCRFQQLISQLLPIYVGIFSFTICSNDSSFCPGGITSLRLISTFSLGIASLRLPRSSLSLASAFSMNQFLTATSSRSIPRVLARLTPWEKRRKKGSLTSRKTASNLSRSAKERSPISFQVRLVHLWSSVWDSSMALLGVKLSASSPQSG